MIRNKTTLQTGYYNPACTKNHCIEKASNSFYRATKDALGGGPYICDICGAESPGVMHFEFDPMGLATAYEKSIKICDQQRMMYAMRLSGARSYLAMVSRADLSVPPCDLCEETAVTIHWQDGDPSPRCESHRDGKEKVPLVVKRDGA